MDMRTHVREAVARAAGAEPDQVKLEHPELAQNGDYSTNIALVLKKGKAGAEKIKNAIKPDNVIAKVEVAGPGFINIWIRNEVLVSIVKEVITQARDFGKSSSGLGKRVIIDYSAPNIAKAFGIGHLRSTIIGQALYNLYRFLGFETIGDNHLGDWGTQFGKLLYMLDRENPKRLNIEVLEEMYVRFHQMAQEDKSLEEKAREWFVKLEQGDATARNLWKQCWDVSMAEFYRIYDLLGVKIDETLGESFYEDKMGAVIEEAKKKGLAHESEGAWVIEIPGMEVPLMILKSDGATTYATRDLATIAYRMKRWQPVKIIYEVGGEQGLYFAQIFQAAKMLGYTDERTELVHTKHGLYLDTDGKKFSTRKGKTVKLEEILLEAVERAKKLGEDVNEETARKVGIGAIKYFDLKHGVQSDIVFDWEKMFELQGNSGPYLQYTYARTQSIISKVQGSKSSIQLDTESWTLNFNDEELAGLRWIYRFPEVVEEAANRYSPNLVCNYLFELAARFNTFYNKHSILTPPEGGQTKQFRVAMTAAVGQVLYNGLNLLGIEAPEVM